MDTNNRKDRLDVIQESVCSWLCYATHNYATLIIRPISNRNIEGLLVLDMAEQMCKGLIYLC